MDIQEAYNDLVMNMMPQPINQIDTIDMHEHLFNDLYNGEIKVSLQAWLQISSSVDRLASLRKILLKSVQRKQELISIRLEQRIGKMLQYLNDHLQQTDIIKKFVKSLKIYTTIHIVNNEAMQETFKKALFTFSRNLKFENMVELFKFLRSYAGNKENEQFCLMLLQLWNWIENREKPKPNMKLCEQLPELNEEKVLIIKWQLLRFFSSFKNSQFKTIQIEDESQKILETLKTNPYKQLLIHVITKDCSNESSSKLVQQILQFTLETDKKKPYYKFRTEKIRADLLTCQVIELAIKQTYFGLSRLLHNESIAVKENGLVSKYTLKMIAEISEKVQKQSNFELDVVYIIAQLFKKVLQYEHKPILYYTDKESMEIQGQNVRMQYACSLFLILIKYFHTFIEEDSAIELGNTINLNLFSKFITALLKDKGIKQKPIFQKVLQSIYSFCVIVPTRRSFQQLVTYDSEISKLIKNLMLQSKQMPRKWQILRSMRSIFLKWNENVNIQQNAQFKQIINRFFEAYLDKKLILPTNVRSIFSNYNINKSLSAYCLVKITEELKKFITTKEQAKQYSPQQQAYLHKIMLMINPRFKGKTEEMFQTLKKIYDNYAHEHQCIHHYRIWIIQNTKIERQIQLSLLQSKLAYFRDSLKALIQINNKQPQQIEFWLSKSKPKNVQNIFVKKLNDAINSSNNLVNSLQIKSSKYEANAKFYELLIQSLLSLNKLVFDISNKLLLHYRKKAQLEQDVLQATFGNLSSFAILQKSCRNIQLTLRYYLLNNDQMISGGEQFFIMSQLGQLFLQIGGQGRRQKLIIQGQQKQQKQIELTENGRNLALLVNILGLQKVTGSHHLQKIQFFSRKQRGRAQDMRTLSLKRTNQLPLNLFTSFYQVTNASIFNCFIKLDEDSKEFEKFNLKYHQKNYQSQQAAKNISNDWFSIDIVSQKDLINTIIQERKTIKNGPKNKDNKVSLVKKPKFQTYTNLLKSYLIFPSLQVGGQAWFNGKIHSESKQDMAYAVLHHQFQTIVKKKEVNYLIKFQQHFSKFFENLNNKTIVSLASKAQQIDRFGGMRGRPPPRDMQRIRNQIISMGYPEELAEIVLENNEILETDQALQWIDMNRNQLDHIMIDRLEQRSRHNRGSNRQTVSSVQYDNNIKLEPMNISIFWDKIDAFLKQLTKLLFGQVFSEVGKKVTKLLFICLSAFRKADFKSKQYTNLSKKMFQIINQCGNIFENPKDVTNKLKIAISILLESIQNDQKSCKQFLEKSIGTKLLVLLPKMNDNLEQFNQTIQDILKLINLNLPVIDLKKQFYANQLKDYMHFICNVFMNINLKSNLLTPILYKIASMKDPELVEKVIKVVCYQLSLGNLSSHVFPLLVLINESNTSFVEGAMQQDIKGFILQNYGYKNTGVIEVDTRLFSLSMKNYDQKQSFVLVSKRLFQRKAKSNVKFIYNCEQHNLLINETLNSEIIKYEQNSTQRVVVDCLINLLKTEQKKQNSIQYLRQLRKILQYYKILIPYTTQKRMQILHKTLQKQIEYGFISWILNVYCLEVDIQSGMQFVEFMMLNNNIFINQHLDSFGDYVISETIANLPFLREQYEQLPNKEQLKKISLFFIIYFLQNKKFMNASQQPYSVQNPQSLKGYLQRSIDITLQKEDNPQKNSMKMTTYALQMEAISLINRYSVIKSSIDHKFYKFVQENETENEKQYIPIDIMFEGQSFEQIKENNNSRFKQEQRIADQVAQGEGEEQQQSDNQQEEVGIAQERLFARNRQFLSRNWVLGQDDSTLIIGGQRVNSLNFFQPIQQQKKQQQGAEKKDKQKMQIQQQEKKPEEQSEQQKQIQITEQKTIQKYQITILQEVRKALPTYQEILITFDKPALALPERQIKINNENIPLKIVIAQPKVIIENTFEKVKIFINRIALCFKLIYPNRNWAINQIQDPTKKKITVRLSENIRGLGELREQMMMHIERLLNRRRVQEGNNTQAVRPLNVGPILQGMTEYVQPPKQQKKQQNPVQQKDTEKMQIQQKQEKKQEIPAENMQIQQKQGQNKQEKKQEQIKPQEKAQEKQPQQKSQMQLQEPVESLSQLQQLQHIQQNIQLLQGSDPIQEENVDHLEEVPLQPQPIIQRQILAMLGLPQSFLRDIGVDEELFDQLPQQEQIYQLTQLRNSQQPNNNQQNAQGQAPQNIPGSQPYNQNAVLFASMDPSLRAQLLLQATPQVLATLPPQMRAQAENIRQRQLNQIIRQQQMEDQQSYMKGKKIPKNLKYPKIPKSIYPNIEQPLIKKSMQGLYISVKKFRIQNYRFLLENKKTRQQAISSLICFLRDQESIKSSNWYQCSNKLKDNNEGCEWAVEVSDFSKNHKFKKGLLQLIYEVLMYSPIKDKRIFSKRISRNGFGSMKVQISELSYGNEQTYQPSLQLLQLSLNNHSGLAIEMMKFVKKIPYCILEKIVGCMKKGKLLDQFYEHMQVLSDSSQMKELIEKQFPESSPPKFELLAKILKYNFSRLDYLHKMHEEALTNYNPNYNEFLNQIFHIYGKQDIKKIEPMLLNFKKIHFEVIKHLYATGRPLDNQPLGIILKFPNLLDFETKKFLFRKHPKIKNTGRFRLAIEVSRQNIFQDSFNQIMSKSSKELQGRIQVTFIDEPGYDAGGLARQWFEKVSKEIFKLDYALFQRSSSGNTYQPNPKSYINPDHINYFKFIGRFVGKALTEGMLLDSYFTRAFYKVILGQQLEFSDLQQQDYNFYRSMQWMKTNNITDIIDENFCYLYDNFGKKQIKQIIPGGKAIPVTQENKNEYIEKYCLNKMRDDFSLQMKNFMDGFNDVVPNQCISFFEAKELQLLISGLPSIDISDMKSNTDYSGYAPDEQIIKWFWEVVEGYTQDQIAKLLQFITGTSRIPAGGFSQLVGMNGLQRISIHRDPNTHQLPKAHTCFNQLDLPNYPTKEMLKQRLRIAITQGHEGFGFM